MKSDQLATVVRALHEDMNPPEGYRAEIVEGRIEVSPPAVGRHAYLIELIRRPIEPSLPAGTGLFSNIVFEEPEIDRYIPDLAAWPIELLRADTDWALSGDQCGLVVEVTSPEQERRDYAKAAGYARAGVPVYLLTDWTRRTCIVYSEADNGAYRRRHEIPFGKPIPLPLPTPVTIETADF